MSNDFNNDGQPTGTPPIVIKEDAIAIKPERDANGERSCDKQYQNHYGVTARKKNQCSEVSND